MKIDATSTKMTMARNRALKNALPQTPLTPGLFALQDPEKTSANDLVKNNIGASIKDFFSRMWSLSIGNSVSKYGLPPGSVAPPSTGPFTPLRVS